MDNSTKHRRLQFSIRGTMLGTAVVAVLLALDKWDLTLGVLGAMGASIFTGFFWERSEGRTGILGAGFGGGLCAMALVVIWEVASTVTKSWFEVADVPDLIGAVSFGGLSAFLAGLVPGLVLGLITYVIVELVSEPQKNAPLPVGGGHRPAENDREAAGPPRTGGDREATATEPPYETSTSQPRPTLNLSADAGPPRPPQYTVAGLLVLTALAAVLFAAGQFSWQAFVAIVPCAAGSGVGYWSRHRRGHNGLLGAAIGGAVGLVLAVGILSLVARVGPGSLLDQTESLLLAALLFPGLGALFGLLFGMLWAAAAAMLDPSEPEPYRPRMPKRPARFEEE